MKASELVNELVKHIADYGDSEVSCFVEVPESGQEVGSHTVKALDAVEVAFLRKDYDKRFAQIKFSDGREFLRAISK